jgi:hypothetical protein
VEADLGARRTFVRSLGPALFGYVAEVAPGVVLGRDAVLDDGRFEWGDVLSTDRRSEKVPISPLVAAVLRALDGSSTLDEVVGHLAGGDEERAAALRAHVPQLVETMHAEGILDLHR